MLCNSADGHMRALVTALQPVTSPDNTNNLNVLCLHPILSKLLLSCNSLATQVTVITKVSGN